MSSSRLWIASVLIGASILVGGCEDDDATTLTLNVVSTAKGLHGSTTDLGGQGKTPGDVYVFDGPLLDDDEQKTIGRVYGTQTSLALTGDAEIVQAMITYDLGDGNRLTIGGISEYPPGDTGLKVGQEFERPIIGGTGEYAGADGTATTVRRPDGSYEQTFRIEL